jgi:hypothetical protein
LLTWISEPDFDQMYKKLFFIIPLFLLGANSVYSQKEGYVVSSEFGIITNPFQKHGLRIDNGILHRNRHIILIINERLEIIQ